MTQELHEVTRLPLRTVSGYQAVVDYLRREIALGRLRVGDRLPSERKLAEQLGVARETLRQALRVLEASGQVSIQRGASGGAIVRERRVSPDVLRGEVLSRANSIRELAEFRSIIEAGAARMAAAKRTANDLAAMSEAQQHLRDATTIGESRDADTEFHLALANAARNARLTLAIEDSRAGMFDLVDLLGFQFLKESSLDAHQLILDSITRGDEEGSAAAMVAHLHGTREEFERLMEQQVARSDPS